MGRGFVFGLLLCLASLARAEEPTWMSNSAAQFSAGFAMATVSDITWTFFDALTTDRPKTRYDECGTPVCRGMNKRVDVQDDVLQALLHCSRKVAFGMLGGMLLEYARVNQQAPGDAYNWDAIRWGAYGGLVSVAFHF